MSRILVISHLHPMFSKGGAETAAYNLFRTLARKRGNRCFFFAAAAGKGVAHLGSPIVSAAGRANEYLLAQSNFDHFLQSQRSTDIVWHDFGELLRSIRPDIVHFHHYTHLGLEFLRVVRNQCPEAALIVTLHEYLAICHNHGQMMKTERHGLCDRASPQDCHACYPDIDGREFFLRELFVKSFFELVDLFISPSAFLCERYVAWGVPRDRFAVLENGTAEADAAAADAPEPDELCRRFGFFGQLSELKGVFVLLKAMEELKSRGRDELRLTIHGDYGYQPQEFRDAFLKRSAALAPAVGFEGPYANADVGRLMRAVGWVVVPSIWWENSPLVIQEAFRAGRPVICSDIGGMAEKVTNGVNGLHFKTGDAVALADALEAAARPEAWSLARRGIKHPPTHDESAQAHLWLYRVARHRRRKALLAFAAPHCDAIGYPNIDSQALQE